MFTGILGCGPTPRQLHARHSLRQSGSSIHRAVGWGFSCPKRCCFPDASLKGLAGSFLLSKSQFWIAIVLAFVIRFCSVISSLDFFSSWFSSWSVQLDIVHCPFIAVVNAQRQNQNAFSFFAMFQPLSPVLTVCLSTCKKNHKL